MIAANHFLETFRDTFTRAKCFANRDEVICLCDNSFLASKTCTEANIILDKQKFPLVAIHPAGQSYFIVRGNETPDI